MKKCSLITVLCSLALILAGGSAFAHNLWINPSNHFPKVGDTVEIGFGWGHQYNENRQHQEMKADRIASIKIIGPEGTEIKPAAVSGTKYTLAIKKAGAYLITAGVKPGVFTKTPKGRKWSDKRGVENPIACTSFCIEAKSLILAGESDANLSGKTGQALEIIPLSNPKNMKPGETFDVKVLFHDQPAAGATVNATYAGYTPPPKKENKTGKKKDKKKKGHGHRFPVSAVTDDQGKAALGLSKKGYWMINIRHMTPYPDKTVCDEYMNNLAFTIEVK